MILQIIIGTGFGDIRRLYRDMGFTLRPIWPRPCRGAPTGQRHSQRRDHAKPAEQAKLSSERPAHQTASGDIAAESESRARETVPLGFNRREQAMGLNWITAIGACVGVFGAYWRRCFLPRR